ncbi:unnamed protein product, partial [Meganyctiphanes norvegica]
MSELVIYVILATIVAIVLGFLVFYKKDDRGPGARPRGPRIVENDDNRAVQPPNRAAANRNARARERMRAAQARRDESDEDDPASVGDDIALPDGKVGKKKLKKLQDKADKRKMREAEEQEREEKLRDWREKLKIAEKKKLGR